MIQRNTGSRSQLKVMGFTLEFGVRSTPPLPLGGFSLNFSQMFMSLRQYAELMSQLCRYKVKVTVKGRDLPLNFMWSLQLLYFWKDFQ